MLDVLWLPALGGVMAMLFLLAIASAALPAGALPAATAALTLMAILVAAGALEAGVHAQLVLPIGLGLARSRLALDPLGAFFVLLPMTAGFLTNWPLTTRAVSTNAAALNASILLTLLAGDSATLAAGLALVTVFTGLGLRPVPFAGLVLLGLGAAVLSHGSSGAFDAIKASPPEGWRVFGMIVLMLAGGTLAARWLSAIEPGTLPLQAGLVIIYGLARVLIDLSGLAAPGWWGLPMLAVAGLTALLGARAAMRASSLSGLIGGLTVQQAGWVLSGLAVAVIARSVDLLSLEALALGGAMLQALIMTLVLSLAAMSAQAIFTGAGTDTLDRLGGVARTMPRTAAAMAVAAFGLGLAPLSAGFPGAWMLLQALFATPRIGGWPLQITMLLAILLLALSAGLGTAAVIRAGTAILGRPRTPRAAAAEEVEGMHRYAILGLAAACAVIGLVPGIALRVAAQAAAAVVKTGFDRQPGWLGVQAQREGVIYQPWGLALLTAAGLCVFAVLLRRGALASSETAAAWEGGFAAPPAWMPFGDPATQVTASAFTAIMPALPERAFAWPKLTIRFEGSWPITDLGRGPLAVFAILITLLVLVAVAGPA